MTPADGRTGAPLGSAPRRRSAWRRVRLGGLILVVVLVAIVGLGWFPQEPLRRLVERQLRAAIGTNSRIGRLHVVPGRLQAEAHDLVLDGPAFRLEAPRARIRVAPALLLGGSLSLRELEADSPTLVLRPPPPSETAASDAAAQPIVIRRVDIDDATVVYRDPALHGDVALRGVDLQGSVGAGRLHLQAQGGAWQRSPPVPIGRAAAEVSLSPDLDLDVHSLEVTSGQSRLHTSGAVGSVYEPEPELAFEARLDLADLAPLDVLPPASGRLFAEGKVAGTVDALETRAAVEGAGLEVGGWPVDRIRFRLEHAAGAKPRASARFAADLLGGTAEGEARLAGQSLDAQAEVQGLQTARVPPAAPGGAPLPTGTLSARAFAQGDLDGAVQLSLAAHAAARGDSGFRHRLDAEGSGWVRPDAGAVNLSWRATLDSAPATGAAAAPASRAPRTGATAAGEAEPVISTGLRRLRLAASGTARGAMPPEIEGRLQGRVSLDGGRGPVELPISGTVSAHGGDASARLAAQGLGGSLDASLTMRGGALERLRVSAASLDLAHLRSDTRGVVALEAQASGPVERLSGTATAHIDELLVNGVAVGRVEADLRAEDGRGEFRFGAPSLNVSGRADLRTGPGGGLRGVLTLAAMPLEPFSPLMPAGRSLAGGVTGEAEVQVRFARPGAAEVDARIESAEVATGDSTARIVRPFTVALKNRRVSVEGLEVAGPGLVLRASGAAGVGPGAPLDVEARVEADLAQAPALPGWALGGEASADVRITGTVSSPAANGTARVAGLVATPAGHPEPLLRVPQTHIELAGERLRLRAVEGSLAGGRLEIQGEAPLAALAAQGRAGAAVERARLRATWSGVQVRPLIAAFDPGGQHVIEGSLDGQVRVASGAGGLADITGELEMPETRLAVDDREVRVAPVSARIEGGRLATGAVTLDSEGGTLRLEARADLASGALDATSRGRLELRALSPFLQDAALGGFADVDLSVGGTLRQPSPRGSLLLRDATARFRDVPQPLTDLNGRILLDGSSVRLEEVSGALGGGSVTLGGSARIAGAAVSDVSMQLTARDVALRYPADFKSRIHADLSLASRADGYLLAGEVRAERGLYDEDIRLEETFVGPEAPPATEPSTLLRSIALDLTAVTENPVRVHNNLADLSASGRLRVLGDAAAPAPFGRLAIQEGGRVFLQTREFTVRRGTIIYDGTIDPAIDLEAVALIRQLGGADEVEVRVSATGPLMSPDLDLSSTPSYSEREIASLIATGRRNLALDNTAWIAGEQTAALLAGRLTRNISEGLMDLGLDEVVIEPQLLAREEDPGARFTFGKDVTPALKLVYSVGLNDPESRFFQAQYRFRIGREVTAKVQRDDDGGYTYGLGQRLLFGAPPAPRRVERPVTLESVRFETGAALPEPMLRGAVKARAGKEVSYWDLQSDVDRLEGRLVEAGYMEALVSVRLEGDAAVFRVNSGERYRWAVEGMPQPPDLTAVLKDALFEEDALEKGRTWLLEEARSRGHLRARVETEVVGKEGEKTLLFRVDPGPMVTVADVHFPGAEALSEADLLEAARGPAALLTSPAAARDRIREAYRKAFHLAVEVDAPRVLEGERRESLHIVVPVREGPRAAIASVGFEGASLPEQRLRELARLEPGVPYEQEVVADAVQRLRDDYLKRGHAGVRVRPEVVTAGADVEVAFKIAEGSAQTIGPTVVKGLRRTRESLVRRKAGLEEGEPLDPRKLAAAERELLDLGVFRRVVATASADEVATIVIDVEEEGPYLISYDARFNREERGTVMVDAEWGNVAGRAVAIGGRYRLGADVREARGSVHLPAAGPSGDVTGFVFREEEDFLLLREGPGAGVPPGPDTEIRQGVEVQQAREMADGWNLLYGVRFRRVSSAAGRFDQDVLGIETSLVKDARDNPLDARRGRFYSIALEGGPRLLVSDLRFFRAFGQVFFVRPLGESLTWAQSYRLGLATGLDQRDLRDIQLFGRSTELFRAGGANSIRGFAADSVGPSGPFARVSPGGQAVIVLNQEVRYRHPTGLGAAVFYDAGNVYRGVRDFDFGLRHSVGLGARYESPVGLLRFDVGFPLNRRPDDRPYQWYFTLGQAF